MRNFNMPSLLGFFSRVHFNTRPKWNVLLLSVFSLISVVIIANIYTRNRIQNSDKVFPLCSGNLLDNREHHFAEGADGSYDNSRMISKLGSCQPTRYAFEQVVGCLDSLYERRYLAQNLIERPQKNLHFAFIGDSRIRQQFFNFLKVGICNTYIFGETCMCWTNFKSG